MAAAAALLAASGEIEVPYGMTFDGGVCAEAAKLKARAAKTGFESMRLLWLTRAAQNELQSAHDGCPGRAAFGASARYALDHRAGLRCAAGHGRGDSAFSPALLLG